MRPAVPQVKKPQPMIWAHERAVRRHALRAGIDRRPKHQGAGRGFEEARGGQGFREVASGAKTDRTQLRRVIDQLDAGDVLLVTRLDRLARSTRDLLNTVQVRE